MISFPSDTLFRGGQDQKRFHSCDYSKHPSRARISPKPDASLKRRCQCPIQNKAPVHHASPTVAPLCELFDLVSNPPASLMSISCSSRSHRSAMSSSLVNISSLMFLNFFSTSPRKSSMASASLAAASEAGGAAVEGALVAAVAVAVAVAVRGRDGVSLWTDIVESLS